MILGERYAQPAQSDAPTTMPVTAHPGTEGAERADPAPPVAYLISAAVACSLGTENLAQVSYRGRAQRGQLVPGGAAKVGMACGSSLLR